MNNIILFFLQVLPPAPEGVGSVLKSATEPVRFKDINWMDKLHEWGDGLINFGVRVLLAILIFFVGKFIIARLTKLLHRILLRRDVEGVAATLLNSIMVAVLYLVLGIIIVSTLGVKSVSFAAVLASMGLAVGMALSGQLQNLAGGVIIMLTKPFKIGDFIEAQNVTGEVKAVTFFHTRITTVENKVIYIPNGALSSGVVINYSQAERRRAEWIVGVEYNEDFERVRSLVLKIISQEERILLDPAPMVELYKLNTSSVDVIIRAWTLTENLWPVYWEINRRIYAEFNKAGIGFPFPQLTLHQAKAR